MSRDITEENLQARIRANLLMAYSNKFGYLVLNTGNKSEEAVGYTTLYGDSVGGFAVPKGKLVLHPASSRICLPVFRVSASSSRLVGTGPPVASPIAMPPGLFSWVSRWTARAPL